MFRPTQRNRAFLAMLLALSASSVLAAPRSVEQTCRRLQQKIVQGYQTLAKTLPDSSLKEVSEPIKALLALTPESCKTQASAKDAVRKIGVVVARHSGKVGVLLPLGGRFREANAAILSGMTAATDGPNEAFKNKIVVKDTEGHPLNLNRRLAELVLLDEVAMIIGGSTRDEAGMLAGWSDRLIIPSILLSQKRAGTEKSRNAFHLFPNETSLAESLVGYVTSRQMKRIAVLKPNKPSSSILADTFVDLFRARGGDANVQYYSPSDFNSMEAVAKNIFQIDPGKREEEFKALYMQKKEEAEKAGVPFEARLVSLPPIVDVDAIFIPDNFRTVRHFVKIFRYLGVDRIPLIGNQEWRAQGLVEPREPFLVGSIFVDFVGDYRKLPEPLKISTKESPYLAPASDIATIDFRIIGYHAISIAERALANTDIKRHRIARALKALAIDDSPYFRPGLAFDATGASRWPSFLFRVEDHTISLQTSE